MCTPVGNVLDRFHLDYGVDAPELQTQVGVHRCLVEVHRDSGRSAPGPGSECTGTRVEEHPDPGRSAPGPGSVGTWTRVGEHRCPDRSASGLGSECTGTKCVDII